MSLNWTDRVDGMDDNSAEDVNILAHAIQNNDGLISSLSSTVDTLGNTINVVNTSLQEEIDTKADKSVIGDIEEECPFDSETTVAGKLNTLYGGHIVTLEDEMDAVQEELPNKVSFTDYPKYDKTTDTDIAGVVKVFPGPYFNGLDCDQNGYLKTLEASEEDIDNRKTLATITPQNLDYAVRSVKPKVNTDMDENYGMRYSLNTIHDFGETSGFLITLLGGECGDWVQFDFYSGADPTTIEIQSYSGGLTDHDFIPEANTAYSLYFDWGIISVTDGTSNYGWRFSYAEYPYTEV